MNRAQAVILPLLANVRPGADFTADHFRYETGLAQLTSAEIGGALKSLARAGYVTSTDRVAVSSVGSRKGGSARIWVRTGKPVPASVAVAS